MASYSANIFTAFAGVTILFQLALIAGAPWGALTQGGQYVGTLPLAGRLIALVSVVLLAFFMYVVRARAAAGSTVQFRRTIWAVVAYCALGIVANAATPSAGERMLWLPVVSVMFLTSLHVARSMRTPRDSR